MVQADVGDDRDLRAGDDVGCVQQSAHAAFQYHNICPLAQVIDKGRGADNLKLGRGLCHRVGNGLDLVDDPLQIGIIDLLSAQLNALMEAVDVGGSEQPRPIARGIQNGGQHRCGAALAVGSGDVNEFQLILWVAQLLHQYADPVQTRYGALTEFAVDIGDTLINIHGSHLTAYFRAGSLPPCMVILDTPAQSSELLGTTHFFFFPIRCECSFTRPKEF